MNLTYLELAALKFAAQKLLEAVHQIEAINITTGGSNILTPHEYLDSLLDDVDSASKTIMHVTAIGGEDNEKSISVNSDRVGG